MSHWQVQLLEFIYYYSNVCLVNLHKVGVTKEALDCQKPLLFLLLHLSQVLCEGDLPLVSFRFRSLLFIMAFPNQQVQLVSHSHPLVFLFEVFSVSLRNVWLSLDRSYLSIIFFFMCFLFLLHIRLELFALLMEFFLMIGFFHFFLEEPVDFLVVPLLLSQVCLVLSLVALVEYTLDLRIDV